MRCTKCGYDNVIGDTCVKCGTPLTPSSYGINYDKGRIMDADLRATRISNEFPNEKEQLKSTVIQNNGNNADFQLKSTVIQGNTGGDIQNDPFKATLVQGNSIEPQESIETFVVGDDLKCPKCGYPVTDKFTSCPNCGADFSGKKEESDAESQEKEATMEFSQQVEQKNKEHNTNSTIKLEGSPTSENDEVSNFCNICENCKKEIPIAFSFCPHCGTKIAQKTIKGIRHKKRTINKELSTPEKKQDPVDMHFGLTLVPEENEQQEAITKQYEGPNVSLNRKNTEPDNYTITSKEQAVLSFEEGNWFIENRSKFDSTLLVINRKIELQSGDIIMLGDRRFKFTVSPKDNSEEK